MSIDISKETLQRFSDVAKTMLGRPHLSTLHRWRQRGVRGVRLETCLIGGRRYTSLEAIERFAAAINSDSKGGRSPVRTPRQRDRAIARAEREMGVLPHASRSIPSPSSASAGPSGSAMEIQHEKTEA